MKNFDKIAFYIRNNKNLKRVLKQPVILVRKCKTFPIAKKINTKIVTDINNVGTETKKIWYFCAPAHKNLGDLAQYICIHKWIEDNYKQYKVIEIPTMGVVRFKNKILDLLDKSIKKEDIFVFQSGYTMSDEHPDDDVRKMILSRYKENKSLVFPQTILYRDENKLKSMKEVINNKENLLLLARDQISFDYGNKMFKNTKMLLYPDIVTTLIGTFPMNMDRKGIALCVRNDGEKYYPDNEIIKLKKELLYFEEVDITDTECDDINEVNIDTATKCVYDKLKKFSKYKIIITDRYHGTIFSLISGTPVIVIKTNDHKVSSGVNWFKGVYDDNVWYCDSLDAVVDRVKEIHNNHNYKKLDAYFKTEYYDKLKEKFEKC